MTQRRYLSGLLLLLSNPKFVGSIVSSIAINNPNLEEDALPTLYGDRAQVAAFLVLQLLVASVLDNFNPFKNEFDEFGKKRRIRRSLLNPASEQDYEELAMVIAMQHDNQGCLLKSICGIYASNTKNLDPSAALLQRIMRKPPRRNSVSAEMITSWKRYQQAAYMGYLTKQPGGCEEVYNQCPFSLTDMSSFIKAAYDLVIPASNNKTNSTTSNDKR